MHEATLPPTVAIAERHARDDLALQGALLAGWAPGRVNLIGEHTDYNEGYVLPIAIERTVALVGQVTDDGLARLFSAQHGQVATFALAQSPTADDPQDVPLWARYVAGAAGELRDAGYPIAGFSAAIAGDVPLGAGMSSSAALIMATLTWLTAATGIDIAPMDLARLGQRAETRGTGVRVGILDHAASALGQPGQALLIDCRSMAVERVPFTLDDAALLVCETGVEHSLATSGYNERRTQCEAATAAFAALLAAEGDKRSIRALRDVTERDLQRLGGDIEPVLRQRARHVLSENIRTLMAVTVLRGESMRSAIFGNLLLSSHASLRDDYAVSSPELDAVVQIATRHRGSLGARLMGAGFGGSAIILAPLALIERITADLHADYPQRTGRTPVIHHLAPAGGPGTARLSD